MNLAESMKHVLITKSQNIFTHFWKEDLKVLLKETAEDVWSRAQSSGNVFKNAKEAGFKQTFKEFSESTVETFKILKIVPRRVRDGFKYFKEDFIAELDSLEDNKEKAIFCLKVIGVLSSSLVKSFYGMKKSQADFSVKGLKVTNAFTRFLIAEIIFKISQVLVLRVLNEVEKELTEDEDKKNVMFFRSVLADSKKLEEHKDLYPEDVKPGDKALELVENLKKYISTGVRT